MNKKEQGFWERYLWSVQQKGLRSIENCYSRPSSRKVSAYNYIVSTNPGARLMTVVAAGCQTFSVGWLEQDKNGNWGFRYETACNSYSARLSADDKVDAEAHGLCPWKK